MRPTPAWLDGRARVDACTHCGTLIYQPVTQARPTLRRPDPCPICGRDVWREMDTPTGPFHDVEAP